jgi:hypothetical protein
MARKTRIDSYGEPIVEAFDLDECGTKFTSFRSAPAIATKDGLPPDDPVPLFLCSSAEELKPPGLGKAWDSAVISPRTLKACIAAASAAAIVSGIITVVNPLVLFASAKASLIGRSPGQPDATPMKSTAKPILAVQSTSAPAKPSTIGVGASSQPAGGAPTREQIAAAFKTAHQGLAEIRQPPAAAPSARLIDADELAALLNRAKGLIAIGDITAARLLLERAADGQEASAALLLAQTYDPAVLGTPDARSITPDPRAARGWYQKAARLGSLNAQLRLDQMQD